jgi:hypothetical protein
MSKSPWVVVALISSLVATPTITNAQAPDSTLKEHADDFVHDVLQSMLHANRNAFVHGGFTTTDRFLLQAVNQFGGQRALESGTGYNLGVGGGVDILLRMGFRASYTLHVEQSEFHDKQWRWVERVQPRRCRTIKSHNLALEVMRYMLPWRALARTPRSGEGMWWALNEKSPAVNSGAASNPFHFGPLASFGIQFKARDKWSGRLEAMIASGSNPFTGNKSFRATEGMTIDEPTGVSHTDYRFAAVYNFGGPKKATPVSTPVAHK